MKAIYRHKTSGDVFAIETGEAGNVRSTSGPLFSDDLAPKLLDYDEYWMGRHGLGQNIEKDTFTLRIIYEPNKTGLFIAT